MVALLGPPQAGKTTLATMLAAEEPEHALYLDLELPSDRAKLADTELYLCPPQADSRSCCQKPRSISFNA